MKRRLSIMRHALTLTKWPQRALRLRLSGPSVQSKQRRRVRVVVQRTICDGRVWLETDFTGALEWLEVHSSTESERAGFGTGWSGIIRVSISANVYSSLVSQACTSTQLSTRRLYEEETYLRIPKESRVAFVAPPGLAETLPHAIVGSYDSGWEIVVPDRSCRSKRQV